MPPLPRRRPSILQAPLAPAPDPDLTQSVNFVWTLLAGFLVMFMQSGFALVETGMCRAKNAANTMSMNFLVYPLAMAGFFICGFAFMFGGINGIPAGHAAPPIGGPAVSGTSCGRRRWITCSISPSAASPGDFWDSAGSSCRAVLTTRALPSCSST